MNRKTGHVHTGCVSIIGPRLALDKTQLSTDVSAHGTYGTADKSEAAPLINQRELIESGGHAGVRGEMKKLLIILKERR